MLSLLRKRTVRIALLLALALGLLPIAGWAVTQLAARGAIEQQANDLPRLDGSGHRVALVLGAGIRGGSPTPLLQDRLEAGAQLFEQERVDLVVVSGDNQREKYDEPTAMRHALLDLGLAPEVVAADYGGRRTWDSCVRAHDVFGIEDVIVVTSDFHAPRAVVTCRAAGIDEVRALSVPTDRFSTAHRLQWRTREFPAATRGLWDAWVRKPEPDVTGKRIDPYNACELNTSLAPGDTRRPSAPCPD